MKGAALVALAATIGNFLQGWDNATIAGAMVYIKNDMNLATSVQGLVVAMSLIGATAITTCSGPISDWLGRRPMLIFSSILYFISGLIMVWSPNVYVLCLARLLDGFGIGLAVTLVPLYISETAPPEIRGQLNTLPQFMGSGGMFLSYCMVFGMSLSASPSWRGMLGVLSVPSLLYLAFAMFYLPESPRWLVSKGKMVEAKKVLQRLCGREDVSDELALLVEGLGIGGEKTMEELIVAPADNAIDDELEPVDENEKFRLYGTHENHSYIAKPLPGQSSIVGLRSRHGSLANQSMILKDPLVNLFDSLHEKLPEASGSMRSAIFPNFGSMFSTAADQAHTKNAHWERDVENQDKDIDDYASEEASGEDSDNDLRSPLISRQTTSMDKDMIPHPTGGSTLSIRRHSTLIQGNGEAGASMGIGGGWVMAYKWNEKDGECKRYYIKEDGAASHRGSILSLPGGQDMTGGGSYVHASALVSQSALGSKLRMGSALIHPEKTASETPIWSALRDPGVKRALVVGVGLQILQQFSGINGVLYYTPQILEEAGVDILLSNLGLSSVSASFLISAFTTLLMLPCIAVAMRLMDVSGRRALLLSTIPVLIVSLLVLVLSELVHISTVVNAAISTGCVVIYFCCFVMGYGPIPNILCSEIFPTRVRGLCIAICAIVFWVGDIIVTYSLPVLLGSIGLVGVFGIYAAVCIVSWIFVFLKVPETKGMPLEVITEFFAYGAQQDLSAKDI
ncbi:PREDICTED: monosaccharide-sensing protein 1-like [Tarenaya hassleriana]|uniref:monosaccharide-sensing protein 1-like n=1 Tax=Tarenaya hassleriana TaxID=28532 RepID=UPI00053C666E|nr:PREDICTED: monosaccharide-sensing protein 1-like [Tarenaya hassleriana]XP_010537221.1 PREDICTED: monosaccharide-sensing protein 1-like [Tarenaya hassleriana]XP_010537222.1 PREDICTED: monosaccharide-sensing protein 1-like [Tarenaya hassleriana]